MTLHVQEQRVLSEPWLCDVNATLATEGTCGPFRVDSFQGMGISRAAPGEAGCVCMCVSSCSVCIIVSSRIVCIFLQL